MVLWQNKKEEIGKMNKLKFQPIQPIQQGISQKSHRRERRQFSRHRGTGERISIKPMGRVPIPEGEREGVLVNSSNGGLCIRQDIQLSREQVLRLSLPLSNQTNQKITVPTLGEVRWVKKKVSENEGFLVGVRYLL